MDDRRIDRSNRPGRGGAMDYPRSDNRLERWEDDRRERRDGDRQDRRDGDRQDRRDGHRQDRRDGDRLDRMDIDRRDGRRDSHPSSYGNRRFTSHGGNNSLGAPSYREREGIYSSSAYARDGRMRNSSGVQERRSSGSYERYGRQYGERESDVGGGRRSSAVGSYGGQESGPRRTDFGTSNEGGRRHVFERLGAINGRGMKRRQSEGNDDNNDRDDDIRVHDDALRPQKVLKTSQFAFRESFPRGNAPQDNFRPRDNHHGAYAPYGGNSSRNQGYRASNDRGSRGNQMSTFDARGMLSGGQSGKYDRNSRPGYEGHARSRDADMDLEPFEEGGGGDLKNVEEDLPFGYFNHGEVTEIWKDVEPATTDLEYIYEPPKKFRQSTAVPNQAS